MVYMMEYYLAIKKQSFYVADCESDWENWDLSSHENYTNIIISVIPLAVYSPSVSSCVVSFLAFSCRYFSKMHNWC